MDAHQLEQTKNDLRNITTDARNDITAILVKAKKEVNDARSVSLNIRRIQDDVIEDGSGPRAIRSLRVSPS